MKIDHEAGENATPEIAAYYDNKRLFFTNAFWFMFGSAAALFGVNTAQGLMPLHMQKIGMNPEQISAIMSLRSWVGVPLILYIAHLTDHWQSRWGRRLPFIAVTLPFIAAGMFFFPYMSTMLSCLLLYTVYYFFAQVKYDAYPYLIYDIAKKKYWGRMAGISALSGGAATWAGQRFLMPMVNTHGEPIVFAIGTVLLVASSILMLAFLKEPPTRSPEPPKWNPVPVMLSSLQVGFRDRRNFWLFLAYALVCAPTITIQYVALQGKVNLGMTEAEIGKHLLAHGTIASVLVAPIMGWLVDKIGCVKVTAIGFTLVLAAAWLGYHPAMPAQLTMAYIMLLLGNTLCFQSTLVFIASGVERSNLAAFSACAGAANLFIHAILLNVSGVVIKRLSGGNYGVSFVVSAVLLSLSLPLLFWIDRLRRSALSAETVSSLKTVERVPEESLPLPD